jgi:hypothetical protein
VVLRGVAVEAIEGQALAEPQAERYSQQT